MPELIHLFREMIRRGASDLHLNVTAPPQIRVRGDLQSIPGEEPLTKYTTRELLYSILTKEQAEKLETHWEVDFSYAVPGLARWRVNAFFQRGSLGAAFRIIPEKIRALSSLGVPDSLYELCDLPRGIVLVTGPTGSGKSTTLASMIDVINERRSDHILTVEDPIEFIHTNKNCMVNQREVGADTEGFAHALKSALRQDPDVILVGEMRDLETIQTALTAAETGHLVFGTLHTSSAAKTVDRVIDVFPPHQQAQVRVQLASSLMGVVAQTLVPTADGEGRVVACEVMLPNSAIRNLIREGKVFQIPSVMQTSQGDGMQTLDAALATLVANETISMKEALKRCSDESEFERLVASGSGASAIGTYQYEPPTQLRLSIDALDAGINDLEVDDIENETPDESPEDAIADSAATEQSSGYAFQQPQAPQPLPGQPQVAQQPQQPMMPAAVPAPHPGLASAPAAQWQAPTPVPGAAAVPPVAPPGVPQMPPQQAQTPVPGAPSAGPPPPPAVPAAPPSMPPHLAQAPPPGAMPPPAAMPPQPPVPGAAGQPPLPVAPDTIHPDQAGAA